MSKGGQVTDCCSGNHGGGAGPEWGEAGRLGSKLWSSPHKGEESSPLAVGSSKEAGHLLLAFPRRFFCLNLESGE